MGRATQGVTLINLDEGSLLVMPTTFPGISIEEARRVLAWRAIDDDADEELPESEVIRIAAEVDQLLAAFSHGRSNPGEIAFLPKRLVRIHGLGSSC